MSSRLMSLLVWAVVAASAVYWGLRLFVRPTPVPAQAALAGVGTPGPGDLTRLLGAPPVQPVAEAPTPVADSRFKLVGVVAPRGAVDSGLALISVDGKPARAVAVGREIEPGLRLLAVSHRQAELGAARGTPGLTLALPPLPEPSRGRPGDAPAGVAAPGQPPVMPPGLAANGALRGMPGALPRPAGPFATPGLPTVQVTEQPADAPADNGNPAAR